MTLQEELDNVLNDPDLEDEDRIREVQRITGMTRQSAKQCIAFAEGDPDADDVVGGEDE